MRLAPRWVYALSTLHVTVAVGLLAGMYAFEWSQAGMLWTLLTLVDLPASVQYYVLAWKHDSIAVLWVLIACTVWWYAISRTIENQSLGRAQVAKT